MANIQQIKQYLIANKHTSSLHPITAATLAGHFNISDGSVEVDLRNIIRDAIHAGELIGSNSRGFFMIQGIDDLNNYLDSLQGRAQGTIDRRNKLIDNWNAINVPQTNKDDLRIV